MAGIAAALGARWAGLVLGCALGSFLFGCAEGYGAVEVAADSLTGVVAGAPAAGAGGSAGARAGGAGGGAPDAGGEPTPTGTPCTQAQVEMCPCSNGTEGMRTCVFDASSPLDGFLTEECKGCPPPSPTDKCRDTIKNISESDTDCGGPDCDPCELGGACLADRDCASAHCVSFKCSMTGAAGSGGSGAAGSGGSGAAGSGAAGSGGSGAAGSGGGAGSGGCMCMGLLACCRFDGSCGTGIAPICI